MSEKRVKIASRVKGIVSLSDPNIPIAREWTKKGQIATIPMDIMQDLIYEEGVKELFNQGVLEVIEKEDRIELGLEDEEQTIQFLTENQMLAALVGTVPELKKAMDSMPKAQLEELVELAIQKEITDMGKVDAIKQKTGKDVIKLVQYNRQLLEEPKETE